ncbi:MAG TPA: sugar transferase [Dehalococcoidia bacterium]|jgi:lipopolysaccharide/colanic/teichoic acid biosynthesis glycosyltransferase
MQDLQANVGAYDAGFDAMREHDAGSDAVLRPAVVRRIHDRTGYAVMKRIFDLVVGTGLLLCSLPLWLIAALLIRLSSRGPIVYGQVRIGKDGQEFTCFKFRTMIDGAHEQRHELLFLNRMDGPVFKTPDDPRVTRVGRWLRKASIDELPQLINVLRGEMSIVGPRPQSPEEVERYGPRDWGRLAVKPGVTCIWQVSGRCLIDETTRMQMDLEYVRRASFLLDCCIVLRTVPAVLSARGAY